MCPRCNVNPRLSRASYCRPCGAKYQKERKQGNHSQDRECSECKNSFKGRGTSALCPVCRYSPTRPRECSTCKKSSSWPGRYASCPQCRNFEARQNYSPDEENMRRTERRYSLPPGGFKALLERQGHRCACCSSSLNLEVLYAVHIDHDHSCCPGHRNPSNPACGNCTRGILCRGCNVMLGNARDSVERLQAGIDYLKRF